MSHLIIFPDRGRVSEATATTLSDRLKYWFANCWVGYAVAIISGHGAGQLQPITANTTDTLTLAPGFTTIPDRNSEYVIVQLASTPQSGSINRSDFATGRTVVTTAGTPVQMNSGTSVPVPNGFLVLVKAKSANSQNISVGDSSNNARYTGYTGAGSDILVPGEIRWYQLTNVNLIWIDSQVNGEGVSWSVEI